MLQLPLKWLVMVQNAKMSACLAHFALNLTAEDYPCRQKRQTGESQLHFGNPSLQDLLPGQVSEATSRNLPFPIIAELRCCGWWDSSISRLEFHPYKTRVLLLPRLQVEGLHVGPTKLLLSIILQSVPRLKGWTLTNRFWGGQEEVA